MCAEPKSEIISATLLFCKGDFRFFCFCGVCRRILLSVPMHADEEPPLVNYLALRARIKGPTAHEGELWGLKAASTSSEEDKNGQTLNSGAPSDANATQDNSSNTMPGTAQARVWVRHSVKNIDKRDLTVLVKPLPSNVLKVADVVFAEDPAPMTSTAGPSAGSAVDPSSAKTPPPKNSKVPQGVAMNISPEEKARLHAFAATAGAQSTQPLRIHRPVSLGLVGYRGVTAKNSRFQARIRIQGELRYLGTFDTAEEAAQAYDTAARCHHSHPVLNFDYFD